MHGLDVMLWCCAGIALAAALLALAFLPRRAGTPAEAAVQPAPERGASRNGRPGRCARYGIRPGEDRMTTMSEQGPARPEGLRERKKARTRASIREHALRLFREQGYHATTIEQIAEAAEVSPSTFFRYFPTKEDVVIQDDMDAVAIAAFERQPAELSPIAAFRAAWAEAYAGFTEEEVARLEETSATDHGNPGAARPVGRRAQPDNRRHRARPRRGGSGATPATLPCATLSERSSA